MSKYLEGLEKQLQGKNIKEFTKHCKAEQDLSKILKDQRETEKRAKINKDIQKMLRNL